jgi:hypothetical protein
VTDADDKESVDRAFAELVAGFHLTADHTEPPSTDPPTSQDPAPGSVFEPPRPVPSAPHIELPAPDPVDEADPASAESYDPGPPPPLPRPAWPVLVGWIGLGYALLTVLAIAVGVDLPRWAAWAGIIG